MIPAQERTIRTDHGIMNNQVRPAGPPPAPFRGAAAPKHERPADTSVLMLLVEPIDPDRGYDPYDTAARPRDIWRFKRKRA